jgi:pimeloyl-ACP methyl ester carboxylesterase
MSDGTDKAAEDVVVLVHGLYLKGWTLALQAARLEGCGFASRLFSYASWRGTLAKAAAALAEFAAAQSGARIHFVGHSLGGLVILKMLELQPGPRIGRAVLLGSPYGGSAPAQVLARTAFGRGLLGHSMLEWLDADKPGLGDRFELGVVAGCRSFGTGRLIARMPPLNDGVVAVAEAHIPDARDFILVPVSHTEMLWSREVALQCCAFLQSGRFLHP